MVQPGYKNLKVWKVADELAHGIYDVTNSFPKQELYCLTSQLRRAALSVPTNIVEGYARNSKTEFKRFIVIALGSLAEVKYLLEFSKQRNYPKEEDFIKIKNLAEQCGQLLWGFYNSLRGERRKR